MPELVLNIIITLAGNHDRKSVALQELFLTPPIAISHGRMLKICTIGEVSAVPFDRFHRCRRVMAGNTGRDRVSSLCERTV